LRAQRRRAFVLSVALILVGGCSGSEGAPEDEATAAWAAEANAVCEELKVDVSRLGNEENFIVHSRDAREFAEAGRLAMARIASVPRPPGSEDEIREMVALYTNTFDKYERLADALLDREEALVAELAEEIDDLQTQAEESAADLGADCLAG
jgi:hypothetical protein